MQYILRLASIILVFTSCNSYKTKYPYSINDFKPEFRKHLQNTVNLGIWGAGYSLDDSRYAEEFNKYCSVTDLKKLLHSEHPLLRAMAFWLLIDKDSNNIEHLLLTSLDDTAIISVNHGEFGITTEYCADYYLETTKGYKKIKRQKILDILVEKHPRLQTTFFELAGADSLPEKYYPAVKQMAINFFLNRNTDNGAPYITYEDEKANAILFALSKFKKKEDIDFIKRKLIPHHNYTWQLIKRNPDIGYFSILNNIFKDLEEAKASGPEYLQNRFSGKFAEAKKFQEILVVLSKYTTTESAAIFSKIIAQKLYPSSYYRNPGAFECSIYDLLKRTDTEAFQSLIVTLKPIAEAFKQQHDIAIEESTFNSPDMDYYFSSREYW
jgi:hypothetical protein